MGKMCIEKLILSICATNCYIIYNNETKQGIIIDPAADADRIEIAVKQMASVLIFTMIYSIWWPQIVLFEQRTVVRLKNCLLFCIQHFWKVLVVSFLQIMYWIIFVLFMPWTAFLVPILGVWYLWFVSCFFLYERLDSAFKIEEQYKEKYPEQFRVDEE